MGAVSYTIKTFNPEEAASGALCIVLNGNTIGGSAISFTGETPNNTVTEESLIGSESNSGKVLLGTGICKRRGDLFTITINSTNYTFNSDGTGYSGTARGKYLYRCEVVDTTTVTNNVVSTTKKITRGDNGAISTETLTTAANILIENLTARDEFAAQALRGILGRIDNPSVLSKDELKFYCDAAYKWAEGMLQEAAKSRAVGSITTVSGTSTSSYSDNTEALLAQIASAIGNISISGGSGGDTPGTVDLSGVEAAIASLEAVVSASPYGALGEYLYNMSGDKVRGIFLKNSERKTSAEGVTPETFEKVPLEVHSEGVMTAINSLRDVIDGFSPIETEEQNTERTVSGSLQIENVVGQDTPNPFIVSSTVSNVKVQKQGRLVADAFMIRGDLGLTIGDDEGNPIYVENTLKNDSDNGTDIPLKVENSGELEVSIKNSTTGGNPTSLAVSTDIQDELSDIKESIDNLIDWEKAYEVGTAAISTTAGLFNLRPLPDNILKMRLRISDGNGDKVEISPDAVVTYQWFNDNTSVTDLEGINFKDIISALRDKPSETVTHLQIGSQGINNSQYATPIKIVVDYVYGNTGSNSTNRTVSGSLSIENKNDINDLPIPIKVDSIPWAKLGEYTVQRDYIEIPNLSLYEYVKIDFYDGSDIQSSEGVDCLLTWESESGDTGYVSVVLSALGYIKIPSDATDISISRNNGTFHSTNKIVVYVAGNASSVNVSGGSGDGSTDVSGIVTALGNLTGSKTTNRSVTISGTPTVNVNLSDYYVRLSGDTMTGDLRLKPTGRNYGSKLLFGDGNLCYLYEDTDDHLEIYADKGFNIHTRSDAYSMNLGVGEISAIPYTDNNQTKYRFEVDYDGVIAPKFEVIGGESHEFLKADGTLDNTMYLPASAQAADSVKLGGVVAANYIQKTSDSSSVLLANGGTKALTDFVQNGAYQITAKTIGVLNSDDTNRVYIQWDNNGYLNIKGDNNTPPRGYSFDAPVTQSSDIRLKDVISHEVLGVNEIAEMPLVKFSWKEDKEKKVHFGTIAQDWEKTIPEVISEAPDGMKSMDYGAAAMAAGVTACREIVALKEENKELKKTVEYLKKELEAIKEIVYGKKENDMED